MARTGILASIAAILLGAAQDSLATPLHGLGAVFQAQRPEVYAQTVTQAAEQSQQLRAGTVDDLRKIGAKSSSKDAPAKRSSPSSRSRDTARGTIRGETGKRGGTRGAPQGGAQISAEVIRRPLAANLTKNLIDQQAMQQQGRMQARELIEVLAYFNAENVNWDGHMGPGCDYPGFRRVALESLPKFGEIGAEAVVQAVGEELTGVTIPREVTRSPQGYVSTFNSVYQGQRQNPLTRDRQVVGESNLPAEQIVQKTLLMNPTYHGDLVDLLQEFNENDLLTPEMLDHLKTCAAGKKPEEVKRLAEQVARAILGDPSGMATADLVVELDETTDLDLRQPLLEELATRRPAYAEIKDEMRRIEKLAMDEDPKVSRIGRQQWANAFQRAPISHCLYWLSQTNSELGKLIWEQVDGRIARADAERRGGYRDSAVSALGNKLYPSASQSAALELLGRLGDQESIEPVVKILPRLPRESWGAAGKALRQLTGQDFGPRSGADIVDVIEAQKKWDAWLRSRQ